MIVPFLKKNKKFSLYDTLNDINPKDIDNSNNDNITNIYRLGVGDYDFIGPFVEGLAIAKIENKSFYLKPNGLRLNTDFEYNEIRDFKCGIAPVSRNYSGKYECTWNFINKNGIEITKLDFKIYRNYYNNGIIEVLDEIGDTYYSTLMTLSGNLLFDKLLESTTFFFHENYIEVLREGYGKNRKGLHLFYTYDGIKLKNINLRNFDYVGHIRDNRGIASLKDTGEIVIIDNEFNVVKNLEIYNLDDLGESYNVIEFVYGYHFFGKVCPIKKFNKWGLIDYNGDFVLIPKYDFIGGFTDIKKWNSSSYGCAGVGIEINSQMKYSAINSEFQEISDFIFDEINLFDEGIANVRIGEKWGAINSEGEIVVPLEFNSIHYCNKGKIIVALGDNEGSRFFGKYGLYSSKGQKLTMSIYEELHILYNGYVKFKKNNKWGLLNNEGKEVISELYDHIEYVNQELLIAERDNEKFYIDYTGREFRQKS